jgi:ribosomal protein S18 acetylase RimI-like enzyme
MNTFDESMRDGITIRPIRSDDVEAFKALRLEALKSHPSAFGSDYHESLCAPESFWRERMQPTFDNTGRIFLADAGEQLAAMTGVLRDKGAKVDHSAFIWGVYVRPAFRGRGLAERLIRSVIEWCESEKVRIVRLTVVTTNLSAIRCYKRCGFEEVGVQPEVIRVGDTYHDELLMWRRI